MTSLKLNHYVHVSVVLLTLLQMFISNRGICVANTQQPDVPVELWRAIWGGSDYDRAYGVTVDSSDDIIVSGLTSSSKGAYYDGIVLKYSKTGSKIWSKTWVSGQGDKYESFIGVAADSQDNIVTAGSKSRYSDLSPSDAVLVKYSPSGILLWNTTWGGSGEDDFSGWGIAIDSSDNIIMSGKREYRVDGLWRGEAFVTKYSPSGILLWNTTWGGPWISYVRGVAVDSGGDIFLTGECRSSNYSYEAFLVKFSDFGAQLWNATWGGKRSEIGYDLAVDSYGNTILAGYTYSFGIGGSDAFVIKYSPSGILLWNTTWGGSNNDYCRTVAIDSSANILIGGSTYSFTESDHSSAFIVKCSGDGVRLWNVTWGGSYDDDCKYLVLDSNDKIVVAGDTESFGSGTPVTTNIFVTRYGIAFTPDEPQNLTATPGIGKITLSWTHPLTNGGAPITSYKLYRGTSSNAETFLKSIGNITTLTDESLSHDQIYYYKVSAQNAAGEGSLSDEASATPLLEETDGLKEINFYIVGVSATLVIICALTFYIFRRKSKKSAGNVSP